MNFGFIVDNRKCIGCHACTVACKSEHEVPIGVNRTWVKYIEKGEFPYTQRTFTVMRCNHCANAPCVEICPVTALYTRTDGIVDFDNQRCIGCKACTQACPYDALFINPENNTAAKCNYCAHRVDIGLEPACVNVCPEHAIVSGDLENPQSEIATLLNTQRVQVRKPEKGTKPKLFYIDGDGAALTPIAAEQQAAYVWSAQARGVGHHVREIDESSPSGNGNGSVDLRFLVGASASKASWWNLLVSPEKARRVYDAPSKGILWGWEVPAYLWTKAIASGAASLPFSLSTFGRGNEQLEWIGVVMSLVFLGLTGLFLIADLDRPDRFLNVLFRPQWKSWLVKGAYTITCFGGLLTFWIIAKLLDWHAAAMTIGLITIPFAILSAVYTAFLFAQAKGRDYWQHPTLPVHMFLHSIMAGSAALVIASGFGNRIDISTATFLSTGLLWSTGAHALLSVAEMFMHHATQDAKLASKIITHGKFKMPFWLGVILVGNILPIIILGGKKDLLRKTAAPAIPTATTPAE